MTRCFQVGQYVLAVLGWCVPCWTDSRASQLGLVGGARALHTNN